MTEPTRVIRGAVAAATLLVMAGCGSSSSAGSSQGAPTSIKLAVSGPMTGDAAADGLHMKQGAALAVEQINAGGGIRSGKYKGAKLIVDY